MNKYGSLSRSIYDWEDREILNSYDPWDGGTYHRSLSEPRLYEKDWLVMKLEEKSLHQKEHYWVEFRRRKSLISQPKVCWKFAILTPNEKYNRLNSIILTDSQIPKKIMFKMVETKIETSDSPTWGMHYDAKESQGYTNESCGFCKTLEDDDHHDILVQCYLSQEEIDSVIKSVEGDISEIGNDIAP